MFWKSIEFRVVTKREIDHWRYAYITLNARDEFLMVFLEVIVDKIAIKPKGSTGWNLGKISNLDPNENIVGKMGFPVGVFAGIMRKISEWFVWKSQEIEIQLLRYFWPKFCNSWENPKSVREYMMNF